MKTAMTAAFMTGFFCACFAVVVDFFTDVLTMGQAIAIAGLSGFLGSLFATLVLKRDRGHD